jgi:hypothetical protein
MMPNYYIQERLAQAHRQDLLREAEHQRLLAQLPRPRYNLLLLLRLLFPWRALRTKAQKRSQRRID